MKKIRYVYFDKITGAIKDILSKRKRGRSLYIECDNDEVAPFIMGKKGIHESIVVFDRSQKKYVLMERDNIIKLRYYGQNLYKIPKRTIKDYDFRLDLYKDGKTLEVTIDPTRMSNMYATSFQKEVEFEKGTEIRIFVMDKEGKELFKTIVINAQELLDNIQMVFDLEEDRSDNIAFYTHRVFDNYMWKNTDLKFLSPMKDNIKFEIQKADLKRRREDYKYHLEISNCDEGIEIKNNIESLILVKIFDYIDFYIVDKNDPSILYHKFSLKEEAFESKKIIVKKKISLKNKTILYNHKYISVLVEG